MESLVNSFAKFDVHYTCINGQDLLEKLEKFTIKPDLILMDVNMPVLNGIEATTIVREKYSDIDVIGLSVEENEATITKMLRAGACSYLVKDVEKSILELAMEEVIARGFYYTKKVSNVVKTLLDPKSRQQHTKFKERELEFIKHACSDLTYKEIAEKMFLSPKTIDGYRDSLFKKLQMKNRTSLVLYAIRNKLVSP